MHKFQKKKVSRDNVLSISPLPLHVKQLQPGSGFVTEAWPQDLVPQVAGMLHVLTELSLGVTKPKMVTY